MKQFLIAITLAAGFACGSSAQAQTEVHWTAGNGDFFTGANWEFGSVPGATDFAVITNGATATMAATAGTNALAAIRLGPTEGSTESGHIIMNGGFLNLSANLGDPKAVIGFSTVLSTFIMNGGTIYFDGPDQFPGEDETTDTAAGVNSIDWEVGERGKGRFEMHSNAVFRASDDLKIAENAAGDGSCLIDGNAKLSVGSGISISSGGTVTQTMTIAGNALVESGNSLGAGNTNGCTDEGYLTMAIGGGRAKLTIQDNAILNIRCLTARQGESAMIVKDHGQFHIFDVLRSTHTAQLAEPRRNSSYGSDPGSTNTTLTLQDDAIMTVNTATSVVDDPISGLTIGGRRGGGDQGGKATLIVQDRASFRVEQDLALGDGSGASSDGTLKVIGPNASVSIGGDLNLAYHVPDASPTIGTGTVHMVITGPTHTKVVVGGIARITNGVLKVTLSGYQPHGGEIYTNIQAASFDGQPFLQTDFSEAPLFPNLSWSVEYMADKVLLKVSGTPIPLTIAPAGAGSVTITWPAGTTLQQSDFVTGPYADVGGSPVSPLTIPASGTKFYRARL